IVGTGGIGRATARLLRAVGIDVRGAGRRPRDRDEDFGVVVDSAHLADHLAEVDHLVMAAPLTDATRGMLGAQELAALPDGAHVINVGRGELVDQPALTAEIAGGRLSAHLDVVVVEPLPDGDPLWRLDGAHISPHMSGDVVGWRDTLSAQFLTHLRTWCGAASPDRRWIKVEDTSVAERLSRLAGASTVGLSGSRSTASHRPKGEQ